MRKSIISAGELHTSAAEVEWFDLARNAKVEVTSEAEGHPIEAALVSAGDGGWRAAAPGRQTVRLLFDEPKRIRRVMIRFSEPLVERTQEFVLRCVSEGLPPLEIVRQQWTFSPGGSTEERQEYQVGLPKVTALELTITPNISGGDAVASLAEMRVA